MNFKNKVYKSLSNYKKECYPKIKNGNYNDNPYPHIFPKKQGILNILEPYRDEIVKFINHNNIKPQTTCLNT